MSVVPQRKRLLHGYHLSAGGLDERGTASLTGTDDSGVIHAEIQRPQVNEETAVRETYTSSGACRRGDAKETY